MRQITYEQAKELLSVYRAGEKAMRDAVAYFESKDADEKAALLKSWQRKRDAVLPRIKAANSRKRNGGSWSVSVWEFIGS